MKDPAAVVKKAMERCHRRREAYLASLTPAQRVFARCEEQAYYHLIHHELKLSDLVPSRSLPSPMNV